jgi:hypothetical protein
MTHGDRDGRRPTDLPASWVDHSPHIDGATRAVIESFVLAHRRDWKPHPGDVAEVIAMLEQLLEGADPAAVFKLEWPLQIDPRTAEILRVYDACRAAGYTAERACLEVGEGFGISDATVRRHVARRRERLKGG